MRHLDPDAGALAQRLAPDRFDFDRALGPPVNERGGWIGSQLIGEANLFFGKGTFDRKAEGIGGGHEFIHEGRAEFTEGRCAYDVVGGVSTSRNGQPIEGHVPHQFSPKGFAEAFETARLEPAVFKHRGDGIDIIHRRMSACADLDRTSTGDIADEPTRCFAVDPDLAEPSKDFILRKKRTQSLYIAEAILNREELSVFSDEGRKQLCEALVLSRLQRYDDEVDVSDLAGRLKDLRRRDSEVFGIDESDMESVLLQCVVVAANEKANRVVVFGEVRSDIAAESSRSNDSDRSYVTHAYPCLRRTTVLIGLGCLSG